MERLLCWFQMQPFLHMYIVGWQCASSDWSRPFPYIWAAALCVERCLCNRTQQELLAYINPVRMTCLIVQMIEQQPSQVGMGDAHQFVQTFDSSQRLLGQIVENQQGQVLSLTLQEPQQRLNNVQEQARKREKHKRKERKNRQKRK